MSPTRRRPPTRLARRALPALIAVLAALASTRAAAEGGGPVMPVAANSDLALATGDISASAHPYRSFTGSPSLSLELGGLLIVERDPRYDDGRLLLRPALRLRVGPLILAAGAMFGEKVWPYVHIDVLSYQSHGWEVALGAGFPELALRVAVPFATSVRATVNTFGGVFGFGFGLGVEATPW